MSNESVSSVRSLINDFKLLIEAQSVSPDSLGTLLLKILEANGNDAKGDIEELYSLLGPLSDDEPTLLAQVRKLQSDLGQRPQNALDVFNALNDIFQTIGQWDVPESMTEEIHYLSSSLTAVINKFIGISGKPANYSGKSLQTQITELKNTLDQADPDQTTGSAPGVVVFDEFLHYDDGLVGQPMSMTVTPDAIVYCPLLGAFVARKGDLYASDWNGCEAFGEKILHPNNGETFSGRRPAKGQICIYRRKGRNKVFLASGSGNLKFMYKIPSADTLSRTAQMSENRRKILHLRPITQNSPANELYKSPVMRITLPTERIPNSSNRRLKDGSIDLSTMFPNGLPEDFVIMVINCHAWYIASENKLYWSKDPKPAGVISDLYVKDYSSTAETKSRPSLRFGTRMMYSDNIIWEKLNDGRIKWYRVGYLTKGHNTDDEETINRMWKYKTSLCNPLQAQPVDIATFSRYIDDKDDGHVYSRSIQIQKREKVRYFSRGIFGRGKDNDAEDDNIISGPHKRSRWIRILNCKRKGNEHALTSRLIGRTGVYRARRKTRTKVWSEWRYFSVVAASGGLGTDGGFHFKVKYI